MASILSFFCMVVWHSILLCVSSTKVPDIYWFSSHFTSYADTCFIFKRCISWKWKFPRICAKNYFYCKIIYLTLSKNINIKNTSRLIMKFIRQYLISSELILSYLVCEQLLDVSFPRFKKITMINYGCSSLSNLAFIISCTIYKNVHFHLTLLSELNRIYMNV